MSNKALRAFSAGLIISTGIFAVSYYYITPQSSETVLTKTQVDSYLAENELTAISNEEYVNLTTKDAKPAAQKKPAPAAVKKEAPEKVHQMTLVVSQGMSTGEVCDELQRGKIIKNSDEFLKYLRSTNREGAVRFGAYKVNSKMSAEEVAKIITSP